MNNHQIKTQVVQLISAKGYKPLQINELATALHLPVEQWPEFFRLLRQLEGEEKIEVSKSKRVLPVSKKGKTTAKILSLTKNGGFAALTDQSGDIFIQKHRLLGAMPGDIVSVRPVGSTGRLPEAEVVRVEERNFKEFTGTLYKRGRHAYILPDAGVKDKIEISRKDAAAGKDRDKVFARMKSYASKGAPALAEVLTSYGPSDSAAACCAAVLDRMHVRREFPQAIVDEAIAVSGLPVDGAGRLDLRDKPIFTIDGAHTKDIDDAVSVDRTADGYRLGVHIADVSHYVRPGSELDREAFARGTSIYYADSVISMLPKELSNGSCSLNPQEDRLAFTVLIDVDRDGQMQSFELHKSILRSRVKGVYDEINRIFSGEEDEALREKYAEVLPELDAMRELADTLRAAKKRRGAIDFDTSDSEITVDEAGIARDVRKRVRGESEQLIEEFMLLANEAVSTYANRLHQPFIYRIHEQPDPSRLETLAQALKLAGFDTRAIRPDVKPKDLADLLGKIRGTPKSAALNDMVLRSLAKARYSPESLGHFGLALKYYSHFTSPIRRYPDLAIHRILTDLVAGREAEAVRSRYQTFVQNASERSSATEIAAMQVEWDCDAIYKAEYMTFHIGGQFEGVITGVKNYGIYVMLDNSVEGLVRVETLPGGWFDYDEATFSLYCARTGIRYTIGDRVKIIVARADVSSGQVDFELI